MTQVSWSEFYYAHTCRNLLDYVGVHCSDDCVEFSCPGICGRTINQSSEPQKSNEIEQYDAGVAMIDDTPYNDQNLQFLENSPVLLFVESLPQQSHFRPLAECDEVKREGLALGHMMTFANVVKKTSELQINAPGCNFDSLFNCLSELELHGFDVKAVQSQSSYSLAIGERKSRTAENKIGVRS